MHDARNALQPCPAPAAESQAATLLLQGARAAHSLAHAADAAQALAIGSEASACM